MRFWESDPLPLGSPIPRQTSPTPNLCSEALKPPCPYPSRWVDIRLHIKPKIYGWIYSFRKVLRIQIVYVIRFSNSRWNVFRIYLRISQAQVVSNRIKCHQSELEKRFLCCDSELLRLCAWHLSTTKSIKVIKNLHFQSHVTQGKEKKESN